MNSIMRFAFFSSFFVFVGLCFPQAGTKAQPAQSKTTPPPPASAPKTQDKPAEEEVIPAAAPNALFPALVARVNGKPILGRDLERIVRAQLAPIGNPEWKNLREDYRNQLITEAIGTLINAKLIYQKATASGMKATDAEVKAEFDKIAKTFGSDAEMNVALANQFTDRISLARDLGESLVVSKYIDENISKRATVTPEEVSQFYAKNPDQFQHPDIVRTSQILIQAGATPEQDDLAKQRAETILARVKKGEDFAKLAREYSMDSSASQGGDIGFASKDALAPEYAEAAFSLPVGSIRLVKTQFGYHILKVVDKKKEGLSTLEEVRKDLTDFLKKEKVQAELDKLVTQLRVQGKVEILIPTGQQLNP